MSRFYGDGTTIHNTGYIDIETHNGEVIAVWFRCQTLRFNHVEVDEERANLMKKSYEDHSPPEIRGFRLKFKKSAE